MTVGELIKRLENCPQGATVVLFSGAWDSDEANEDSFGFPAGISLGANCVHVADENNVYILHATKPDETLGRLP